MYSSSDDTAVFPFDCSVAVPANVTQHTLIPGFYDGINNTVVFTVSTTTGLTKSTYRLMGCNAGLQSLAVATFLDGNADGTPGDDYVLDFSVKYNNLLNNPNFTQASVSGWDKTTTVFDAFQDADRALLAASVQLDPDSVTNNDSVISQCVAISGSNKMRFGASLVGYIGAGSATLKVEYNDDNVCAGIIIGTFSTTSNYTVDLDPLTFEPIWTDVSFDAPVPVDALSAKVSVTIDATQPGVLMDRAFFVSVLDHVNLSVDENITVTDDVILLPSLSLDITENIVVNDDVVLLPSISLDILENIVVSDNVQILLPIDLFINENIVVSDNVALLKSINLDITEMVTVTDGIVLLPSLSLDISELITVTDDVGFVLSVIPPRVVNVKPIAGLCQGDIQPGDQIPSAVTELEVSFSAQMLNPTGDTQLIDVNNPDNYRLISSTDATTVLPSHCEENIGVNMTEHTIFIRNYDENTKTVVLATPIETGIPKAYYHLLACYPGLHSTDDVSLDGNADGASGDDYVLNFSVKSQNLISNPNFTDALSYWIPTGNNVVDVVMDADNAIEAGSAYLDSNSTISQCVVLNNAKIMRLGTSLISEGGSSNGKLSIQYFSTDDCQGEVVGEKSETKQFDETWHNNWIDAKVPALSQSARITIEAMQTPLMLDRTYFIKSKNIFSSGFDAELGSPECTVRQNDVEDD